MKFTKGPTIIGRWIDHMNRRVEFDIQFTVSIPRQEMRNHTNVKEICEQAFQLLMVDPRRSDSFPVNDPFGIAL